MSMGFEPEMRFSGRGEVDVPDTDEAPDALYWFWPDVVAKPLPLAKLDAVVLGGEVCKAPLPLPVAKKSWVAELAALVRGERPSAIAVSGYSGDRTLLPVVADVADRVSETCGGCESEMLLVAVPDAVAIVLARLSDGIAPSVDIVVARRIGSGGGEVTATSPVSVDVAAELAGETKSWSALMSARPGSTPSSGPRAASREIFSS